MSNIIWLYWEGVKPDYIKLCHQTIIEHCSRDFDIRLLSDYHIPKLLPGLRSDWYDIKKAAHKADYLRIVLLYKFGGIWLDSDMIVMRNLAPVVEHLKEFDFVGCGRSGNRPSNGFLCASPGCKLFRKYIDKMDLVISSSSSKDFAWTELGYKILWPLAKNYKYFQYPFKSFVPISPSNPGQYFSRGDVIIDPNVFTYYLYNAMFPGWFKKTSTHGIMNGNWLISKIFRYSLGDCRNLKSIRCRKDIPKWLKSESMSIIAEVGVRNGAHLESLLKCDPSKLVAVDMWDSEVLSDVHLTKSQVEKCYKKVVALSKRNPQIDVRRGCSKNVAHQFKDGYFDFVYLDGDHTYSGVLSDINAWWPKVRFGGVLGGHDYILKNKTVQYGVVQAVHEFIGRNNLEESFHCTWPGEQYSNWFIRKQLV